MIFSSSRSGRIKKIIAVLFFSMSFISKVLGQVGDIHVELKVGLTYDVTVEEVTEWGFWLSDGSGLLFSQLRLITSESDSLIKQIEQLLPAAVVLEKESVYTIYFEELNIPQRSYKKRTLLGKSSFQVGTAIGYTWDMEFYFATMTQFTGPFIFNIGKTVGWSLIDDKGFLGGYTFGVGISIPIQNNDWNTFLNIWEKYSGIKQNRGWFSLTNLSPAIYSVTSYYNISIFSDKYTLSTGLRYYLTNLERREIDPKLGFLLTLGIKFGT